jgi:FKBP-type peptidyl-prolyl cis-trans isomerase FkpA/FKBP-type peptidyl-prolyl cis-trans isomerase FklB
MRRQRTFVVLLVLSCACSSRAADPELKTDDDKTLYAIGASLSGNLTTLRLTEAELELVKAGLTDGALNRTKKVDPAEFRQKMQLFAEKRMMAGANEAKQAGKAFVDKAVAEEGATRKPSGLAFKSLSEGTGPSPTATDKVKVHYTGRLIDGTVFDSSVERAQPATFALNAVVACWTEGLQLMKVGGKARLYCPSDIAYGDRGRPSIPPGATLVFEVELLEIVTP